MVEGNSENTDTPVNQLEGVNADNTQIKGGEDIPNNPTTQQQYQPKREWSPELARELIGKIREPKSHTLSFPERCELFAYAYSGTPNRFLSQAFRVSQTTVSYITGCLEIDPDPYRLQYVPDPHPERRKEDNPTDLDPPRRVPHDHNDRRNANRRQRYEDVRREFEALGETEFCARYMTKEIYNRIAAARREEVAARRDRRANRKARP